MFGSLALTWFSGLQLSGLWLFKDPGKFLLVLQDFHLLFQDAELFTEAFLLLENQFGAFRNGGVPFLAQVDVVLDAFNREARHPEAVNQAQPAQGVV
ncbi:hypothetical protein PVA48_13610 [Akkermansia sp. JRP_AM1]|uniref:hypothetical protein n=1 Tax=Akkermansia sp. JRP_AM1 TaxID=3414159 RepID=UPI003BFA6E1D